MWQMLHKKQSWPWCIWNISWDSHICITKTLAQLNRQIISVYKRIGSYCNANKLDFKLTFSIFIPYFHQSVSLQDKSNDFRNVWDGKINAHHAKTIKNKYCNFIIRSILDNKVIINVKDKAWVKNQVWIIYDKASTFTLYYLHALQVDKVFRCITLTQIVWQLNTCVMSQQMSHVLTFTPYYVTVWNSIHPFYC